MRRHESSQRCMRQWQSNSTHVVLLIQSCTDEPRDRRTISCDASANSSTPELRVQEQGLRPEMNALEGPNTPQQLQAVQTSMPHPSRNKCLPTTHMQSKAPEHPHQTQQTNGTRLACRCGAPFSMNACDPLQHCANNRPACFDPV